MGITNKFIYGQDITGLLKDMGNALLSHYVFNNTGRKGYKGPKFPVNNTVIPCNKFLPGTPIKMAVHD